MLRCSAQCRRGAGRVRLGSARSGHSRGGLRQCGKLSLMKASEGPEDVVYIQMSRAEALILFEWIHRHEDVNVDLPALVNDEAERAVLWGISGALEKLLPEPFSGDYDDTIADAQRRVTPDEG